MDLIWGLFAAGFTTVLEVKKRLDRTGPREWAFPTPTILLNGADSNL